MTTPAGSRPRGSKQRFTRAGGIDPENSQEFDRAIRELGRIRRRDGASYWGVFRDVADPGRHLETFLVGSWSEHMRQHARLMEADHATEDEVRAFHLGEEPPVVSHFVADHLPKG